MENKLFIYTRVSQAKDEEETEYSLRAQKDLGTKKAKSLRMDYEVFEERGKSAEKEDFENRPQMKKLLDLCEGGEVKNVFATELDRLVREPILQHFLKKIFKDQGIILYTINQDKIDFRNYDDEMLSDIITAISKRENRQRVARSKRGMFEAVKQGKWHGGILPFGYSKDESNVLIPDKEEAPIYVEIVEMSLKGVGVKNSIHHAAILS